MAYKLSDLTVLAAGAVQSDDPLLILDVHDFSMSQAGTDKTVTVAALLGATLTVTAWTWHGVVIAPTYGGTGVANNAANTLTFTGAHSLGLTLTANTSVTLPTSGTLVNSAVTTLSSLTTIGTLVAGAVPASLVTAGTFGAGAYTFPGAVGIGTGSPLTPLVVSNAGAEGIEINPTGGICYITAYNRVLGAQAQLVLSGSSGMAISIGPTDVSSNGSLVAAYGFGCNGKAAQMAYASGGTLAGVVAALVANGILSN